MEISTQITINTSPERIWKKLMDFSSYPVWNPFIKEIYGDPNPGNTIIARIHPPGAKGMTFRPKVIAFEPNKKFAWLGHLILKGLFDGEHRFELIHNNDGTTTMVQGEKFSGILVPLFKKIINVNTVNGFNAMNQKLKEICESEDMN